MKLIGICIAALFLMVSFAVATDTTLSDSELTMGYEDIRVVEFCLSGAGGQEDIEVVVDPVCKDLNGDYGCQAADDLDVSDLFTATPVDDFIDDGECTDIILETTIEDEEDGGIFYYTVNGLVGDAVIGGETGTVFVPEFTVLGAGLALAGIGMYVSRKRKK